MEYEGGGGGGGQKHFTSGGGGGGVHVGPGARRGQEKQLKSPAQKDALEKLFAGAAEGGALGGAGLPLGRLGGETSLIPPPPSPLARRPPLFPLSPLFLVTH